MVLPLTNITIKWADDLLLVWKHETPNKHSHVDESREYSVTSNTLVPKKMMALSFSFFLYKGKYKVSRSRNPSLRECRTWNSPCQRGSWRLKTFEGYVRLPGSFDLWRGEWVIKPPLNQGEWIRLYQTSWGSWNHYRNKLAFCRFWNLKIMCHPVVKVLW